MRRSTSHAIGLQTPRPVAAAFVGLALVATTSHAQKLPVTLTLDPGTSVITFQGTVHEDFGAGVQPVPLTPQKVGSDTSQWTGTLTAVFDVGSGRLQLTGGENLVPSITGDYCPAEAPTHGGANDAAQCPTEAPAMYGFTLDLGFGTVEAATRDWISELRGMVDVTGGNVIDTLHLHHIVAQSNNDFDDTGGLDGMFDTGTLVIDESTSGIAHNEPQGGDVLNSFFLGTFDVVGSTASIQLPLHALSFSPTDAADTNGDGIPDQRVELLADGELNASGTFGAALTDGDANMDGKVDGLDVNIYSAHFEQGDQHAHALNDEEDFFGHPRYAVWTDADFNMDGIANDTDFSLLVANFGAGTGGGSGGSLAAVPEPASLLLTLLAAGMLSLQRRPRMDRRICPRMTRITRIN